jgi:type III secretory pathway component EscS
MQTVVQELVSCFQALTASLFLLALVLIGLAMTVAVAAYRGIVIKRFQATSKATQENFDAVAADLRKRALEVKKHDEGLRKRDLEVKERDELRGFVKGDNAEFTEEPQRLQQQQVLKGSQRALKESVSQIITVGLKDIQTVCIDESKIW